MLSVLPLAGDELYSTVRTAEPDAEVETREAGATGAVLVRSHFAPSQFP